jgi:hypothetical protein
VERYDNLRPPIRLLTALVRHTVSLTVYFCYSISFIIVLRQRPQTQKTKKLETSDMNHFFMLNEVTRHIIVDDNAATNTLVNDENGNEMDISLCMDIFSTFVKEDVFRDDDELNISFGRKGSNGSPVCVSAYFDDAIGYSTSSFDSEMDVVNDNTVVETDVVDVDEIMEFVDPDKLEKAISELCDPILKQERKGLFQLNYSPCVCIAGSK